MCYLFLAKQVACENEWIDGEVPAEIGEENAIESGSGTVTKVDDKWYKVDATVVAADNTIGFTWYKEDGFMPEGNDCVYVKGFVISIVDYSEDFVYDEEYNPNPLKFEVFYSVTGLRATEVDDF